MAEKIENSFDSLDAFFTKINAQPSFVQEAMYAVESADINWEIIQKYKIPEDKIATTVNVLAKTIIKDIPLDVFPKELQKKSGIQDPEKLRKVVLEFCTRRLLPLRSHLQGIENLIVQLGGTIPEILPTPPRVQEPQQIKPTYQLPGVVQKDIRTALIENQEIGNQLITEKPIKLRDYNQPVRPSIKNWLIDYQQKMGVEYHSPMERADYLFNSENAKELSETDREVISSLIKSYDERLPLPFDKITGRLTLELIVPKRAAEIKFEEPVLPPAKTSKIIEAQAHSASSTQATPPQTTPPPVTKKPTRPQQPPSPQPKEEDLLPSIPSASSATQKIKSQPSLPPQTTKPKIFSKADNYREPIEENDIEGPVPKPVSPPPNLPKDPTEIEKTGPGPRQATTIKLNGNLIDLKNIAEDK